MQITACRAIRWVYWDPKLRYNAIEFGNRSGEPVDIVSKVPRWIHQIFTGKASPVLHGDEELTLYELEYWLFRLAARALPNPVYFADLWHSIDWRLSAYDRLQVIKAPLIWYDCINWEFRVGNNFNYAKRKTIAEFRAMNEQRAIDWLNQGFSLQRQPVCTSINLRNEIRRTDGY